MQQRGFTGIALEILLLFAFQNMYGYLYERMGVIVAIFMVGLALGGCITNRMIQKGRTTWIPVLIILEGVIGCYALALPCIIHALSSHSIIAGAGLICLTGITGMLTGIEFPLVNKIFIQHRKDITISAGLRMAQTTQALFGSDIDWGDFFAAPGDGKDLHNPGSAQFCKHGADHAFTPFCKNY